MKIIIIVALDKTKRVRLVSVTLCEQRVIKSRSDGAETV